MMHNILLQSALKYLSAGSVQAVQGW